MLFPLKSMAHDSYGIMQAWREGGYSDDLIVAAKCAEHELKILCPSSAVFPQRCLGPLCISSKVPSPPPPPPPPPSYLPLEGKTGQDSLQTQKQTLRLCRHAGWRLITAGSSTRTI